MAYDERYPYREDRLMQEEPYGRFAGDDGSFVRRGGTPRPMDDFAGSLSSGAYRPPTFSDPPREQSDLGEDSFRRIFGNDTASRYDAPPVYDREPFSYERPVYTAPQEEERLPYVPRRPDPFYAPPLPDPNDLFAPMPEPGSEAYSYDNAAEALPSTQPEKEHRPRLKKRGLHLPHGILIACGVVLAVAAVLLGILLVDKVFTPKMMRSPTEKTEEPVISTDLPVTAEADVPADEDGAAEETEQEEETQEEEAELPFFGGEGTESQITIPEWSVFVVQAGAFAHPENADQCAMDWQSKGSAGYVLFSDDYYRVMTTVFSKESDAEEVRAALAGQNPSAQVYQLSFGEMTFTITAREEDLTLITTAIAQWPEWIRSLMAAERKMEAGDMDASAMLVSVKEVAAQVSDLRDQLEEIPGIQDSPFLSRLLRMYAEAARILSDAAAQESISAKSLAMGRVKYAHIGMCWNYRKLVEEIAAQSAPAEKEAETPAE